MPFGAVALTDVKNMVIAYVSVLLRSARVGAARTDLIFDSLTWCNSPFNDAGRNLQQEMPRLSFSVDNPFLAVTGF